MWCDHSYEMQNWSHGIAMVKRQRIGDMMPPWLRDGVLLVINHDEYEIWVSDRCKIWKLSFLFLQYLAINRSIGNKEYSFEQLRQYTDTIVNCIGDSSLSLKHCLTQHLISPYTYRKVMFNVSCLFGFLKRVRWKQV